MRETIIEILNNNGIFVNEDKPEEILEMDSVTFLTIIVDIENAFGITFPDDQITNNDMMSVQKLEEIVSTFSFSL